MEFSRWRAGDIRSILATNGRAPTPHPAGGAFEDAVVLTLPTVPTRSLEAYKIATGSTVGGTATAAAVVAEVGTLLAVGTVVAVGTAAGTGVEVDGGESS